MKKISIITLVAAGALAFSAQSANAEVFAPTNFTIKAGLGSNSVGGYVTTSEIAKKKSDKLNPLFAVEFDYGIVGKNIIFAGTSYASAAKKYTLKDNSKAKTDLSTFALYTGLRFPFADQGAAYGIAAGGLQFSSLKVNQGSDKKDIKTRSTKPFAQLGLGYSISNVSIEGNVYLSSGLKNKVINSSKPSVFVLSVGYTF